LILLGAPGTGKGTQAQILVKERGWLHVSSGDILRAAIRMDTQMGRQAKAYMDKGELVPDDLIIRIILERISRPDGDAGVVLDGFPRTVPQARALEQALGRGGQKIDLAINISVPEDELVRRLSGRWVCRRCAAIYQESSKPPTVPGRCDNCGGELIQRDDDRAETVRARLEKQKPPQELLDYFKVQGILTEVDGEQTLDGVTKDVARAIDSWMGRNGNSAKGSNGH
jgi:adenylate kinase